jgi:hypothetical protein
MCYYAILKIREEIKGNTMKLIQQAFKHNEKGFIIDVTTCNSRVVTTHNRDTNEIIKFNRSKFEWMINKKIFSNITGSK